MNKRARTLLGVIILIAFVIASSVFIVSITKGQEEIQEKTDHDANIKTITHKNITITAPRVINCKWTDPDADWKLCEVEIAITNHDTTHDFTEKNSPLSKFKHDVTDMEVYTSPLNNTYEDTILNSTCFNLLNETLNEIELEEAKQDNSTICRYNTTRYSFNDWKLKEKLDKFPKNATLGMKLIFKTPILIDAGQYLKNQFNFTLVGDYDVTLDPDISDCAVLSTAGATYTLTANISNSTTSNCINITAENVTLDCRNNIIDGDDEAYHGIVIRREASETTNATIRYCELIDWKDNIYLRYTDSNTLINITSTSTPTYYDGIYLRASDSNTLTNITANSNGAGVHLFYSDSNTLTNVTTNSNDEYGVYLEASKNNVLIDSKLTNTSDYDFDVGPDSDDDCNNNLTNVIGTDDKPIVYYNSSITMEHYDNNVSGIILCNADKSEMYNVTLQHTDEENNGILIRRTSNTNFTNISVIDLERGFSFGYYSDNNILKNITANSNSYMGISIGYADNNTIINSTADFNGYYGVYVQQAYNNTFINVTANSNGFPNGYHGIYVYYYCKDNMFINVTANSNKHYGISIDRSSNTTIKESEFWNNSKGGFFSSSVITYSNLIYNNLFNNTLNFNYSDIGNNSWNTSKQTGDRIISDGIQIGGNYWANLTGDGYSETCTDSNTDGFCDDTYTLAPDNIDYHPLSDEYVPNTAPSVNLASPVNATWTNDSTPDFEFNVIDTANTTFDCLIYINSSDGYGNSITYESYGRDNSVSNGTTTTITANSTLQDGNWIWYVNCSEIGSANLSNQSQIWNLSVDTTLPLIEFDTGTLANNSFKNQTFIYANWTYTETNLQNITAELFSTTGLVNRTGFTSATYEINWTITELNERYYYNISILDNASNFNKTEVRNITIDTTNPTIPNVSISPNTADDLDPNVQINVTANITDALAGVNTTILQYKFHSAATFTNATMRYSSTTKLYNGSFTPNAEGKWTYRVWANDTANNIYNTTATNVTVEYDYTWVAGKNESGSISGIVTTNREILIIDINNTGDSILSFDISDTAPYGSSYNQSIPFSIVAKGTKTITFNATFGSTTRDDDVIITIDSTTSSASPSERTVNTTLSSYAGGPYLDVVIDTYPSSINQSRTGIIRAYVKNIGNETSIQTWLNWTLPSGVTNTTGNTTQNVTLNETSNLTAGTKMYNTLNITVNETTVEIGSITIYAKATGLNSTGSVVSKEVNKSISINCYSGDNVCGLGCNYHIDTDCEIPQNVTTTTTTAGGGGGGVFPVFKAEVTYELVRGRDQIFILPLENIYSSKTLTNIRVSASGYLAQYIKIEPPENVSADETGEIKVKILAPSYFTVGMHNLTFTIQSVAKEKGTSDISRTEKRYVHLSIHELGKGDSVNLINEIENYLNKLNRLNLKTEGIQELFDKSLDALNKSNYEKVNEMYEQSKELAEAALDSYNIVKGLEEKLNDTSKYKIKTPKTDRLVNLAKSALERGDYLLALERVKDAQLTYIIETKGKFGLIYYIRKNTFEFFLYTIAILILLTFMYFRTRISVINYNLKNFQQEEDTLLGLMKVVQKECFEEKKMSMNEYNDAMLQYEDKLSKAVQKTIELESAKSNLLKFKHEKLESERNKILDLMKSTQQKYLKEGAIETQVYNNKMHSFVSRLSTLEENLAVQEAKQTIRKRKRFWRIFYALSYKLRRSKTKSEKEENKGKETTKNKIIK